MKENKDIHDIGKFFNGYASDFSSIYLEDERPRSLFNKVMDRLFGKDIETRLVDTVSSINTDAIKTVLDIGCGPGHLVVKLLELEKDVTALDIAPNMLSITQARVDSMTFSSNFETILADYSAHEFDKTFDAISVMGFFDYVQDPVAVLQKLIKDTNKEIYISIPGDKGFLAFQRKIRYRLRNCPLYLYSRNSLVQHLKDAGCYEMTEIIDTERGFYIIIRK
jgi:SAM-dependent methyltransferase